MGLDVKDVCAIIWKVIRFSTNTTCRYVKRYPVASGVSAFVIFLYTFLPRIFYVMLFSSPLLACASFYLRTHLSSKMGEEEEKRRDHRGLSEGRTGKAELKHQRSVRRNARREVEEVGKDWDSSQASEDERGKVILTTLYGELPPETITPDLEAFKRDRKLLAAEESFAESNLDDEDYVVVEDPLERVCDGETELECSSSSSSSEEEKETKTVVVAWTEDDQKNLMDLGTSEIERNKRLESLMTRRRSRRLFLLAAERTLMDMEVPRICIGRNYYGFDKENYETDGLIMPGSAPSVLLPRRNPFDLPYDPQEEKPNLTGDSFQQEFADANPSKDIFLCRHESFHHRVFPSESQNDSNLESLWRKTVDGRPRPLQGSNDQLPLMKESGGEAGEVRIETDSIRNDESDSNTTLSPRERGKDFNVSDQSDASETFCKRNEDGVGKSLAGLVPRSGGGSSSLANARQKYMEHFGYSIKRSHVTTHSVDSDLLVEVSELGSPPTSVDGNDSSDGERSLFGYESEICKEMGFSGDESGMLPVGKVDQDLNETKSLASPEVEEAGKLEPMVMFPKRAEDLKKVSGNSADEINMSYDSEEAGPSERTNQEPYERNDVDDMQQLAQTEDSDGDSQGSPTSVLQDMLPLSQTQYSEDLDRSSDPPAESSRIQSNEQSDSTEETTVGTSCLTTTETVQNKEEGSEEPLINDESKSAEDGMSLSINLSAEELKNHND